MGNGVDQSHADCKNSLDGCAYFLPWWLVWELERRCRWTRLRMARPQPRLWLLRPPLPQPCRKSPQDLCVSVKGLVTGHIFIQGGGRKKGNIRGVNKTWKICEKQLTPCIEEDTPLSYLPATPPPFGLGTLKGYLVWQGSFPETSTWSCTSVPEIQRKKGQSG